MGPSYYHWSSTYSIISSVSGQFCLFSILGYKSDCSHKNSQLWMMLLKGVISCGFICMHLSKDSAVMTYIA
jgi:predicted signal transduction protein with EAL and GGDEF domain